LPLEGHLLRDRVAEDPRNEVVEVVDDVCLDRDCVSFDRDEFLDIVLILVTCDLTKETSILTFRKLIV